MVATKIRRMSQETLETPELTPEQEHNQLLITNLQQALEERDQEIRTLKALLDEQTHITTPVVTETILPTPEDSDPYAYFRKMTKETADFRKLIAQLLGNRNWDFETFPGGFRQGAMALKPADTPENIWKMSVDTLADDLMNHFKAASKFGTDLPENWKVTLHKYQDQKWAADILRYIEFCLDRFHAKQVKAEASPELLAS